MLTVDEVFRELQKIARQRALVKASHLTDAMKEKLTAQLDDQAKALEAKILEPAPSPNVAPQRPK